MDNNKSEAKKTRAPGFILAALLIVFAIAGILVAVFNVVPFQGLYPESKSAVVSISVNGTELSIYPTANLVYDVATLNSEKINTVKADAFSGYSLKVNDSPLKSGSSMELKLDRLSVDSFIKLEFTDKADGETYCSYINTLPAEFANGQVISENPEAGFYYFNYNDCVYKMSTSGEVVFWHIAGGMDSSGGGCDFKRTEADGKVFYSFLFGSASSEYQYLSGVGYGRMQAIVLDENYQPYDNVYFLVPDGDIKEGCRLDNHQFTILGDHHYLLTSYIGKQVYNIPDTVAHSALGTRVVANIIQEVRDGNVVFRWDSTEHPELYTLSVIGNDYMNAGNLWADYAHLNAAVVDPSDGNIICSFRNLNAVVKLDKKDGSIKWILGGNGDMFGLSDEQRFYGQNDVRVTADGAITIFNNGNPDFGSPAALSSIMKFTLNESSKTITSFERYSVDYAYSSYLGSAQELSGGHYVIGWGNRETAMPLFSEIDFATNRTLFQCVFSNTRSDGVPMHSYRVYKFDN